MAGIYIHIPFCRRACHYCDFHFTTNLQNQDGLVTAILSEVEFQKDYLQGEEIDTIYFGGGTPSLLPSKSVGSILKKITSFYKVNPNAEITLEANPEDLSIEKLSELKSIGINRLSLGTQSFIDHELSWMNRMHSADQAKRSISNAQKIGFNNISIDLIFGLPEQSVSDWSFNLNTAVGLGIQHISSYGLTIEEKTVLHSRIEKGTQSKPNEDLAAKFFEMNMEFLPKNGFEQYEISNYASDEFISKHNSSYWKKKNYLGLGPSAHSYNGYSRQWNVKSNAAYMAKLDKHENWFESEQLSETDLLNELILTGLRTKWGVSKTQLESIKPGSWFIIQSQLNQLDPLYFTETSKAISLSRSGKLKADLLTSQLFFE